MQDKATENQMPRFLRLPEVERITSLPRSTVYWMMDEGVFPKCFRIGKRAVCWEESEILAWMSERMTARKGAA